MNEFCISTKSKTILNERCKHKAGNNCLCGIHSRSKNIIIFDDINKNKYTLNNLPNFNNCDKTLLKQTLLFYKIKTSKKDVRHQYQSLTNYLAQKSVNEKNSIIIQKYYRKFFIQKLKCCVNQEDFYSLDNILTIPFEYIYILNDNNVKYCFDIRSLNEYFKLKKASILNPYNNLPISDKHIKEINIKINKNKSKKSFKFEKDVLSPRQMQKQQLLSVFQNFDALGFILNIEWFSCLKFEQLKILYRKCEDIWNYRAQLTNEQKMNIVHNGKLFTIPIITINRMKRHKQKELTNIILNDFNRAITEGTNEANKKLGAILMLTGFAEVSNNVINSYPWLSQSF